jgi:hypothetical protein
VTIISNIINNFPAIQNLTNYSCWGGHQYSLEDVVKITVATLTPLISAIHRKNPKVIVLVMQPYPGNDGTSVATGSFLSHQLFNRGVRDKLKDLPNTYWIDWHYESLPKQQELFQTLHWGHPNCRVDKVMAHAAVKALFDINFLSRGQDTTALDITGADGRMDRQCSNLDLAACEDAALCYVNQHQRQCLDYSPGYQGGGGGMRLPWYLWLICFATCSALILVCYLIEKMIRPLASKDDTASDSKSLLRGSE